MAFFINDEIDQENRRELLKKLFKVVNSILVFLFFIEALGGFVACLVLSSKFIWYKELFILLAFLTPIVAYLLYLLFAIITKLVLGKLFDYTFIH